MAIVESRKIGNDRLKELEKMMFGKGGSRSALTEGYESDAGAIREISLFIQNDGQIYKSSITPLITNYAKKLAKDSFDKELGAKGFMYVVETGLKAYAKDFGGKWNELLAVQDRKKLAKELLDAYMEEIEGQAEEIKNSVKDKKSSKKKESSDLFSNLEVKTVVDHSDYFQGFYFKQNQQSTGIGSSSHEAFEDALDQLYSSGEVPENVLLAVEEAIKTEHAELYNDETDQIQPMIDSEKETQYDADDNELRPGDDGYEDDDNDDGQSLWVHVGIAFDYNNPSGGGSERPMSDMPESVRRQLGKKKVSEGEMSAMSIKDYFDENKVVEALVLYDSQYDEYYITPYTGSMTEEKFASMLRNKKIGLNDFEVEHVLEDELDDILSREATYNFIDPDDMSKSAKKPMGEMARHSGMGLDSYDGLMDFLNGKPKKNLPGTQTVVVAKDGAVAVEYRGTAVVTHYEDGTIDLNTGGWMSLTTKDRMNSYLSGISISQRKGQWYISTSKGEVPYEGERATISSDGDVKFEESLSPRNKKFLALALEEGAVKKKSYDELAPTVAKILGLKESSTGFYKTKTGIKTAKGLVLEAKTLVEGSDSKEYSFCIPDFQTPVKTSAELRRKFKIPAEIEITKFKSSNDNNNPEFCLVGDKKVIKKYYIDQFGKADYDAVNSSQ